MSGSEHEEDAEAEITFGCYLKDSVIVSSDEEEQHNDTNMHAIYLQAVRCVWRKKQSARSTNSFYTFLAGVPYSVLAPLRCPHNVSTTMNRFTHSPWRRNHRNIFPARLLPMMRVRRMRNMMYPSVPWSVQSAYSRSGDVSEDEVRCRLQLPRSTVANGDAYKRCRTQVMRTMTMLYLSDD